MKVLEINKQDLIHNINVIKNLNKVPNGLKSPEIIGVVKGNAYGLDLVEFSKILIEQGIEFLAVSTVEEALELRENNIECKILMLSSTGIIEDIEKLLDNNIILTVGSKEVLENVEKVAIKKNIVAKIHLKIDTGFGRYGFIYSNPIEIVECINKAKNVQVLGTFSHFSESFSKKSKWTNMQYERFLRVIETLQQNNIKTGILHICNSSAFLKYPHMRLNAVRIGSAFSGRIIIPNTYGLKRIGTLKTKIAEIKKLPKKFNIGYSNTYMTKKETKVAIIPVGYQDGINMTTSNDCFRLIDHMRYIYNDVKNIIKDNKVYVKINNKRYNVIGKIGMYNMVVDLKNDENIHIGDEVFIDIKPLYIESKIERKYIS